MTQKLPRADLWSILLFMLLAGRLAWHDYAIMRMPLDQRINYLPDDAFYYLIPARHFIETGRWSFDGTSPTTGFHLLFAYWTALLQRVVPGAGLFALEAVQAGVAAMLVLAGIVLVWRALEPGRRLSFALVAALVFAMPDVAGLTSAMMESPFVVFAQALFLALVLNPPARWPLVAAVATGVFGTLARSDFGALPMSFALVAAVLAAGRALPWTRVRLPAAVTAGAAAALVLIALHNLWLSGQPWQGSALVKAHWAHFYPVTPMPFADMLGTALIPPLAALPLALQFRLAFLGLAGSLVATAYLALRRARVAPIDREDYAAIACAAAVTAYMLLYTIEAAAVQGWYIASTVLPIALAAAGFLPRLRPLPGWAAPAAALLVVGIGVVAPFTPAAPVENIMLPVGEWLASHPVEQPIGAWNSGMLSFFSGRRIVDLDGLVNDAAIPFIRDDTLAAYVDRAGIRTIVDNSSMVEAPDLQARGGYPCGGLTRRLDRVMFFETPAEPGTWRWRDGAEALYRVLPAAPDYVPGTPIDFRAGGEAYRYKGCGWDVPEVNGTAPDESGRPATLIFSLPGGAAAPLHLVIEGAGLSGLRLRVGDTEIPLETGRSRAVSGPLPASGDLEIALDFSATASPPVVSSLTLTKTP